MLITSSWRGVIPGLLAGSAGMATGFLALMPIPGATVELSVVFAERRHPGGIGPRLLLCMGS